MEKVREDLLRRARTGNHEDLEQGRHPGQPNGDEPEAEFSHANMSRRLSLLTRPTSPFTALGRRQHVMPNQAAGPREQAGGHPHVNWRERRPDPACKQPTASGIPTVSGTRSGGDPPTAAVGVPVSAGARPDAAGETCAAPMAWPQQETWRGPLPADAATRHARTAFVRAASSRYSTDEVPLVPRSLPPAPDPSWTAARLAVDNRQRRRRHKKARNHSKGASGSSRSRRRRRHHRGKKQPKRLLGCLPWVRSRRARGYIIRCFVSALILILTLAICMCPSCNASLLFFFFFFLQQHHH